MKAKRAKNLGRYHKSSCVCPPCQAAAKEALEQMRADLLSVASDIQNALDDDERDVSVDDAYELITDAQTAINEHDSL